MISSKLSIALFISISAFAKKTPAADAPVVPVAPTVPADVQAEYYRSAWEVAKLQPSWDAVQKDLGVATQAVNDICGTEYQPRFENKKIICKEKPKPPAPAAPAKPETK